MPSLLVTGANRGLGLEFARAYARDGWRVIATCREPENAGELSDVQGRLEIHRLDVTDHAQARALAHALDGVAIDVLFNNAGVIGPKRQSFGDIDYGEWAATMAVNTLAPVHLCECFVGHVARSQRKVMAAMSSQMGSIAEAPGGYYAYRTSKAALNMAMKNVAADLAPRGITVALFHPGWARTRMGGRAAQVDPAEAVAGIREIVDRLSPADTGKFFHYTGREVPW